MKMKIISRLNQNIWCIEILILLVLPFFNLVLNQNIWCIEMHFLQRTLVSHLLEPKHMMYWNYCIGCLSFRHLVLEPKHMMYWNVVTNLANSVLIPLNQNIWCIEIHMDLLEILLLITWTKTYDVLKYRWVKSRWRRFFTWTKTYDVLKSNRLANIIKCW